MQAPIATTSPPAYPAGISHYWSAVLGCEIWVADTDAQAQAWRDVGHTFTYSGSEVRCLQAMKTRRPETFDEQGRAVHDLKEMCGARLETVPAPVEESRHGDAD